MSAKRPLGASSSKSSSCMPSSSKSIELFIEFAPLPADNVIHAVTGRSSGTGQSWLLSFAIKLGAQGRGASDGADAARIASMFCVRIAALAAAIIASGLPAPCSAATLASSAICACMPSSSAAVQFCSSASFAKCRPPPRGSDARSAVAIAALRGAALLCCAVLCGCKLVQLGGPVGTKSVGVLRLFVRSAPPLRVAGSLVAGQLFSDALFEFFHH